MKCNGVEMAVRDGEPELRTWWRWDETGALVYWMSEDVFLSYLPARPGKPLGHEQTAIVRRTGEQGQSEPDDCVLVLHGDHRSRLEHLTLLELEHYYDGCPDKIDESSRWSGSVPGEAWTGVKAN